MDDLDIIEKPKRKKREVCDCGEKLLPKQMLYCSSHCCDIAYRNRHPYIKKRHGKKI